jgi:hypothetical protein
MLRACCNSVPVADVITAPREWFVAGGEGDGCDLGEGGVDADGPLPGEEDEAGERGEGGEAGDGTGKRKRGGSGGASGGGGLFDDCGSLADFAAWLAAESKGGGAAGKGAAAAGAAGSAAAAAAAKPGVTGAGLPRRAGARRPIVPTVNAVVYVQARSEALASPPRVAMQYSLQVRPLGTPTPEWAALTASLLASAAATGAGDAPDGTGASAWAWAWAVRAWAPAPHRAATAAPRRLPPLLQTRRSRRPLAPARTGCAASSACASCRPWARVAPSCPCPRSARHQGAFFLERFVYATDASPARVAASAAAAAANPAGAARAGVPSGVPGAGAGGGGAGLGGIPEAVGGLAGAAGNAAAARYDSVMYVIVGPVSAARVNYDGAGAATVAEGAGGGASGSGAGGAFSAPLSGGLTYDLMAADVPVSGLASAVGVALLTVDRLLVVRKSPLPRLGGGRGERGAAALCHGRAALRGQVHRAGPQDRE